MSFTLFLCWISIATLLSTVVLVTGKIKAVNEIERNLTKDPSQTLVPARLDFEEKKSKRPFYRRQHSHQSKTDTITLPIATRKCRNTFATTAASAIYMITAVRRPWRIANVHHTLQANDARRKP
jgi:hypothetical protein